jgi:threonine dehydratase
VQRPSSLNPDELVRPEEAGVPKAVVRAHEFLTSLGVWHLFSRNREALSCRDAAKKRYRLGHVGIPLSDEMKTYLGEYGTAPDQRYVAIHTRGDRQLRMDTLETLLGGSLRRLNDEEVEQLGTAYGKVNAFMAYALDFPVLQMIPVDQVFDIDLLRRGASPGTVMTNASDYTWAVEFDPIELHQALRELAKRGTDGRVLEGDVSEPEKDAPPRLGNMLQSETAAVRRGRGGKITIITGNAPESGLRLAELLCEEVRRQLGSDGHGDVSMPALDILCLPSMGMSMELDVRENAVWRALGRVVRSSAESGTETVTLACHTTHYFTPHIRAVCARFGKACDFVSMAEATGHWLRMKGIRKVGLIGIRFVAGLDKWSAYRDALHGIEVETPDARVLEEIASLAYRVKTEGVTAAGITRLRDLLRTSVQCNDIVLALTELSLLIEHLRPRGRSGKNLIDPLEIYAEVLADRFVRGFPGDPMDQASRIQHDFELACEKLAPVVKRTRVICLDLKDRLPNVRVLVKCENEQFTNSFKFRGAYFAVWRKMQSPETRPIAVAARSSGNHAAALAKAAQSFGIPAIVVMPENAPESKKKNAESYGAKVIPAPISYEEQEKVLDNVVEDMGAEVIPSSAHPDVICGAGTAALEFMEEKELDILVTPVGGGGLLAGSVLAAQCLGRGTRVIGAEPDRVNDAQRSLAAGKRDPAPEPRETIADGLRVKLSEVAFDLFCGRVEQVLTASDKCIVKAVELIRELTGMNVEPSSAVALAVVMCHPEIFEGKTTGLILTGGNCDSTGET